MHRKREIKRTQTKRAQYRQGQYVAIFNGFVFAPNFAHDVQPLALRLSNTTV